MQKQWLVKDAIDNTILQSFRSKLKINRVLATLLYQRGYRSFEDARSFMRPNLEELHDPFLMMNMDLAVERLDQAIKNKEGILLFGDYDVDGTTAVALLYSVLQKHHSNLEYYIPDRYTEGYGLSQPGIDFAAENDITLLVTLDCGIRSVELVDYANTLGVDVIICDHHEPGEQLPSAIVLDPKQKDCTYPYKELSGCGVGFKLMEALSIRRTWKKEDLCSYLDLVAVSIGADIVPVTGENRILCFHGMRLLNQEPRLAFQELIRIAGRSFPMTLTDVVFTIAPRINAAGRLRSGKYAVELMISSDEEEIKRIAHEINEDNMERRSLDKLITEEALELLESDSDLLANASTVVYKEDWHKGVVGIVASRLIEKYHRPTIVLTESNGKATGSARSVNGFNIHDALIQCEHLLLQFGGHAHAAGMTLNIEDIPAFQQKFEEVVKSSITHNEAQPIQSIDMELDLDELFEPDENRMKIPKLKRQIDAFEPYGPGNMKPVFISRNVFAVASRVLKDEHLKLTLTQADGSVVIDGIGFGLADKEEFVAAGVAFDVAYTLETNTWNGRSTLQLNIKDIRPTY